MSTVIVQPDGTPADRPNDWVFVPLCGLPCAICGQPARFMDVHRYVHHVDRHVRNHYIHSLRSIAGES